MKHCIKSDYNVSEEPPLAIGKTLHHAWIMWCAKEYNCSFNEAIRRGELRIGKPEPKRKLTL